MSYENGIMGEDFSTPIDNSIITNNRQLNGINMSEIIRQNSTIKNNEDLHSVGFGGMRQSSNTETNMNQSTNNKQFQNYQSDPSRPSMEEMERVYNSVQSGEFIPKQSQALNTPTLNQNNTIAPEQIKPPENSLDNGNMKLNDFGLDSNWLKDYVGNDKADEPTGSQQNLNPTTLNANNSNENNGRQQNNNQQPLEIDSNKQRMTGTNDIIAENERLLRTYGARTGLKGDDLIATASSISENEIAMIYRMRQQQANEGISNSIPTKQQPGPDVTGLGSNGRQVGQRKQKPFTFTGMGAGNFGI